MTMDWNGPYFTVGDIRRLVEGKFTTGISAAERAAIDKRVANFLRTKSAPGISIAIAQDDRLVYAKGFIYAKKPSRWALPHHPTRRRRQSPVRSATRRAESVPRCRSRRSRAARPSAPSPRP